MAKYKRIRKAVVTLFAITSITCLSFWGFIAYKRHASYQTLIPQRTSALIRVDVYALYSSMFREYFEAKKTEAKPRPDGIAIPANIFCYTVEGKQATTWFTSLPVANLKKLSQYLHTQKQLISSGITVSGITTLTSVNKQWTILFNKNNVAIAFSANREKVTDVLTDMVLQQNVVPVADSKFNAIANETGHISLLSDEYKGSLNFKEGQISATLLLSVAGLNMPDKITHQTSSPDDALSLWYYGDLTPILKDKSMKLDSLNINGDSILAYHPHAIDFIVSKPVLQKDTTVTYDYNDDFEKVATVAIKESKVPGFSCTIQSKGLQLFQYLQREKAISTDSAATVSSRIFPLYQLHVSSTEDRLYFGTAQNLVSGGATVTSPVFFNLLINFAQLSTLDDIRFLQRYIKPYKRLEASAVKKSNTQVKLDITLHFKNSNRSSLAQLLETF